jgi:hypothetical protein
MTEYKIEKRVIGTESVKTVYDGMYYNEAVKTLARLKSNFAELVIDTKEDFTAVNNEFPLGVNYKVVAYEFTR